MTNSQKASIWVVVLAALFLALAFFGLWPAAFVLLYVSARMLAGIGGVRLRCPRRWKRGC